LRGRRRARGTRSRRRGLLRRVRARPGRALRRDRPPHPGLSRRRRVRPPHLGRGPRGARLSSIPAASDHPWAVGLRDRGIHVLVSVLENATMALLAVVDETTEALRVAGLVRLTGATGVEP